MEELDFLPLVKPRVMPPLHGKFRPAVLANQAFREKVEACASSEQITLALERTPGTVSTFQLGVLPDDHPESGANFRYVERALKFLLWSRGASRVYYSGQELLGKRLQAHYGEATTARFDAEIMGERIFERPFEIKLVSPSAVPTPQEKAAALGWHLDGCRIGFDLGASDRKVAAVQEGQTVFSEEVSWDPKAQSDPDWHFEEIMAALRRAAAHLPRVDAIGGSAAGVYVDNDVRVASLFRGVPNELWPTKVKPLFRRIQEAWGNIPFQVVNDGEVTALAGAMALRDHSVLGIAMGSSEAAGYVTRDGTITSWLNELAFAPIDFHPDAPVDEWSGDFGCGVQYLSQQAVDRLLKPAEIELAEDMPVPEKLAEVQKLAQDRDSRAISLFETVGTYFGYALAHYAEFYDFRYVLALGRVTSGKGGEIILQQSLRVLQDEFPALHDRIRFHQPDETEKRHGQAMAAASLPRL